ncbi:hypothetical protein HDU67_007597 [Dinochytrium kinnereticum]|nr:hypothetical protein HDU67_007597 [Dinochytrium kinnereticum]
MSSGQRGPEPKGQKKRGERPVSRLPPAPGFNHHGGGWQDNGVYDPRSNGYSPNSYGGYAPQHPGGRHPHGQHNPTADWDQRSPQYDLSRSTSNAGRMNQQGGRRGDVGTPSDRNRSRSERQDRADPIVQPSRNNSTGSYGRTDGWGAGQYQNDRIPGDVRGPPRDRYDVDPRYANDLRGPGPVGNSAGQAYMDPYYDSRQGNMRNEPDSYQHGFDGDLRGGQGKKSGNQYDDMMADLMNEMHVSGEHSKTCGGCKKKIVDETQAFEIEALQQIAFVAYPAMNSSQKNFPTCPTKEKHTAKETTTFNFKTSVQHGKPIPHSK